MQVYVIKDDKVKNAFVLPGERGACSFSFSSSDSLLPWTS